MNLFRRNETKKSDFEIEEDDQEQGQHAQLVQLLALHLTVKTHVNR